MDALIATEHGEGVAVARLHEEPGGYELSFIRSSQDCVLNIVEFKDIFRPGDEGSLRMSVRGCVADIIHPFVVAFRALDARVPADELAREWRRPFPTLNLQLQSLACEKIGDATECGRTNG
jgi:hypothetical protein